MTASTCFLFDIRFNFAYSEVRLTGSGAGGMGFC
jgi:hypothetical protein